jgi:FtsH-binding integral membrane protein
VSLFVLILAFFFPSPVAAFDAGDGIALVLGLVIGIFGLCACLGYYARRRSGV